MRKIHRVIVFLAAMWCALAQAQNYKVEVYPVPKSVSLQADRLLVPEALLANGLYVNVSDEAGWIAVRDGLPYRIQIDCPDNSTWRDPYYGLFRPVCKQFERPYWWQRDEYLALPIIELSMEEVLSGDSDFAHLSDPFSDLRWGNEMYEWKTVNGERLQLASVNHTSITIVPDELSQPELYTFPPGLMCHYAGLPANSTVPLNCGGAVLESKPAVLDFSHAPASFMRLSPSPNGKSVKRSRITHAAADGTLIGYYATRDWQWVPLIWDPGQKRARTLPRPRKLARGSFHGSTPWRINANKEIVGWSENRRTSFFNLWKGNKIYNLDKYLNQAKCRGVDPTTLRINDAGQILFTCAPLGKRYVLMTPQ